MDEKQKQMEALVVRHQLADEADDLAFEAWFNETMGVDSQGPMDADQHVVFWETAKLAWKASRRRTLKEHAPRILLAQQVADLIRQLDGLDPKQ